MKGWSYLLNFHRQSQFLKIPFCTFMSIETLPKTIIFAPSLPSSSSYPYIEPTSVQKNF
jgi:hypothetical protein